MKKPLIATGSFGLGAAWMYFMDPQRGRRRRAVFRDKALHFYRGVFTQLDVTSRDLAHRSQGAWAKTRSRLHRDEAIDDEILISRVRSRMGRLVTHPHSIEVHCSQGRVQLSGPVAEDEVDTLIEGVRQVNGVREVESRLIGHPREALPDGASARRRFGPGVQSPYLQVISGGISAGSLLYGIRRRDPLGMGLAFLGITLLGRALRRGSPLLGRSRAVGEQGILVRKSIQVRVPVDEVFSFWLDFQNFPRFLKYVDEVRTMPEGRSHWKVTVPGGLHLGWDAITRNVIPNRAIEWESAPESLISNSGRVRFLDVGDGMTRIDLEFRYHPPGGALGRLAAAFFGSATRNRLGESLSQLKTLLEQPEEQRESAASSWNRRHEPRPGEDLSV